MATFKETLKNASLDATESINSSITTAATSNETKDYGISLLSLSPDEGYTKDERYLWISDYTDNDYSTVDEYKNITLSQQQINLTKEENSQVIPFAVPRYYDGVDLSQMLFKIHYVNANGLEMYSTPINVMYNESSVKFYWLIDGMATSVKGVLKFEIIATGNITYTDNDGAIYTKSYRWSTRPKMDGLNVLESLAGTGTIEPSDGWETYLDQVSNLVDQANSAAASAKKYATDAAASAENVDDAINGVSATITENVEKKYAETFSQYYTKVEVDQKFDEFDISDQLQGIQDQINDLDGLADLQIDYVEDTSKLTFTNGKTSTEIASYTINPSLAWVTALKEGIRSDISDAVNTVSDELTEYKTTNDAAVNKNTADIAEDKQNLADNYYNKTEIDSKVSSLATSSEVSAIKTNLAKVESASSTNSANITVVSNKIAEIEEAMNNINTDPAVRYRATYDGESGLYSLIEVTTDESGEEVETPVSQFVISGGGGGGGTTSTTVTIDRITSSPIIVTKNDKVIIEYNFSSVDSSGDDTGEGTATWKVGNSVVATSMALQGKNSFDITEYITVGTQKVTLTIIDAAGTLAVKSWTVQMVDVRIESTFNDQYTYPIGEVSFDYIPYGSVEKTVHIILDGSEIGTVTTSSSGIPMSYTLPAQTHGSHLLEAYITADLNGISIETNHIYKDIIWYDDTSSIPVIGCIYTDITAKQYDSTNITYVVYDPNTEAPRVTLAVDGEIVSSLTLDKAANIWQYKSSEIGHHTLTITCRDTVKTINVMIEKLDINVSPVTANLAFDFNPSGYSNNSEDRLWVDSKNSSIAMTVSDNFDWVNGGYQLDDNGDQYFCVKAGTTAEISYNLFADDARKNGKEFKLVFKTENVRKSNATFLSCQSGTTLVGLQMNAHEAYVKATGDSLYIPYSEEDIIEFEFNISKQEDIPLVMSYEDGVGFRPMLYTSDYSFTQTSPVPITIGSPDCDVLIYRMKAYSSSLTDSGILSNFIADARNADEMIARYKRNQIYDENNQLTPESVAKSCPALKVIKLDCPHFTNDKKDFVVNTNVECIHVGGDPTLDNWKAINCAHSGQGTTSNEYGQAGRNMDLLMCFDGVYQNSKITYDETYKTQITMGDGTVYKDGTGKITLTRSSVPTNYLNIKVNVASSEMQNNRLGQKFYNDFLPYKSVAQQKNPNVKNSMEFVNCVVFLRENDPDVSTHREFQDCEWHFYALGNVGDSKKTDYSRVNDPTDPKEFVVEIMDNTLPNSTFSGTEEALAALEADTFNEKGTYGFRYEMSGISDEQHQANINKWKEFYRFVATSTDEEFVVGLKNWFIVDSALYFYLFTERYTMIDNRAKNVFFHFAKHYISQEEADSMGEDSKYYNIDDEAASVNSGYRFDFWDYDNDTQLGINNSGELTMTYGKEDTDYRTDGDPSSGYVFNAAESKFFCRIRDLMRDKLQEMYLKCESENCWSAERLIKSYDEAQAEFPEELWRLNIERLYVRTYREGTERFLKSMMNGRKKYQRRQFERDQEKYIGTKYYGTNITSDQIMFRCNTPTSAVVKPDYTLHLVSYSDMYLSVMFGATYRTQIRAKAGIQYDIECPFSTMDDTAVLIYCASRIQSVGDLSACYIHDNDFSKAEKLKVLIIGNTTEGYSNAFLTNLVIGNNKLLETLDIRNTPNLTSTVNLIYCNNLEEFYAEGSGISGVAFANGGKLRVAHLPAITSLNAKNLSYIEDFQVSSFENMQTLIVENTPAIDTYSYVNSSPNLTNVRLIGIDWGVDEGIKDTSILNRLIKLAGIDNSGYNTLVSVLMGVFYAPTVKQKLLADYMDAWPDLIISYDTLITQYTVTFVNDDGTVLDTQYVDVGESAIDPVTREDNPIEIPTKESSVSTDYTYNGWDSSLSAIFSDRTIKAVYTESVRNYTVKYVARGYVKQETVAPYGSSVEYTGSIPIYTDEEAAYTYYLFTGWDQFGYVDGDKTINAVYDKFTYTEGSLDGIEIADMRPVQIYAMMKVGIYQNILTKKDPVHFNMGADYSYENIEEKVLISGETAFIGNNYVDTGIKLLNEDIGWTLVVDYKWGENNDNNSVLMQCYQGDGSNGFRMIYSTNPTLNWGTSSASTAVVNKRDILVLRHVKGETKLHVYKGNLPAESIDYSTLTASRAIAQNSTLVFGCSRADDGVYENYSKGTIYWSKLWYCDLGDDACKTLVGWTHEKVDLEVARYRAYYLSDGSGQRSSVTFLSSKLLENTMPLSNAGSNSGGWAETSLNRLLNTRFYNAIPVEWKQLIKQCRVASSIGDKSTEISTSDNYITIPALLELDANRNIAPFNNEATETIAYMIDESARIRKFANGTAEDYWTRSPSVNYSTYFFYVQSTGEISEYSYPSSSKGVCIELSV